MNRSFIPLFLLLLIITVTCVKDDQSYDISKIVIGDYSNMILRSYNDTVNSGYGNPDCYIDIDGDQTNDIKIACGTWGSPGMGYHGFTDINTLHADVQFYQTNRTDSIYYHHEIDTNGTTTMFIRHYKTYGCVKISEADTLSFVKSPEVKTTTLQNGDIIYKSDLFASDSIFVSDSSYSYPPHPVYYYGDTLVVSYFHRDNYGCVDCPAGKSKYLGVKLLTNGVERLGWIKLDVFGSNKVAVIESAIQR